MSTLPLWLAALWWGSLTTLGFGVVPLLFAYLPTPALAGGVAGKLFAAQTWLSTVVGLGLLLSSRSHRSTAMAARVQSALGFILGGMVLALLVEFAVAPRILARDNLRLWHTVGSAMYLMQWFCASATFLALAKPDRQIQV